MNQKQIGTIVLLIGIALAVFMVFYKINQGKTVAAVAQDSGSCYLPDGTCLHEQTNYAFIIGIIISVAAVFLGVYLIFFDKTQKKLAENQLEIAHALREAKHHETETEKFKAFLAGFTPEEQNVIKAIKEQDGIKQATLRYRTGMSKASLSLLLKSLEERGIITRKESGKTNEVFLRKKF